MIEDSPAGTGAGRAASAQVLAVTTTHSRAELVGADVGVAGLSCVSVEFTDPGVTVSI